MTRRAERQGSKGRPGASAGEAMDCATLARRLREERDRYAELYHRAPVGQLALDGAGHVLSANHTAAQMLGVRPGALQGVPLQMYILAEEREAFDRYRDEVLAGGGPRSCQVTFERLPGTMAFVGHLDGIAAIDAAGRKMCLLAIGDATSRWREASEHDARLRRERALREEAQAAQRRFDRVAAAGAQLAESLELETAVARATRIALPVLATYCAIDLADAAGRVRRVAFAREGDPERDLPLDPYAPRGSAAVVRSGRDLILTEPSFGDAVGLASAPEEIAELRRSLGSYLCLPLRAHGRVLGAMTFVREKGPPYGAEDVSLAHEVARQAAFAIDNARLYREAQEADRRKDEFLAMLGHELRNPLAAVVFAAARLRRVGDRDEAAQRTAEVVERQASRLVRLVDDLLDASRITRGQLSLQRRRVDFADILARAVESARPLYHDRRHHLVLRAPRDPVVLDADPARLEQVVVNLLVNAAKYTPPGGHVEVDVTRVGGDVEVRVRDDGVGLAPDHLAAIFAPFTQIDPPIDRNDGGLGIGLTLAQKIVEMHGGRIQAHSAGPGLGSEMSFRIPLDAPALAAVPREQEQEHEHAQEHEHVRELVHVQEHEHEHAQKILHVQEHDAAEEAPPPSGVRLNGAGHHAEPRRRVLVVEDHPDVAAMLEDELAAMGQEVRVAHDGPEAVGAAIEFSPELLLIDIGLPGLTGYDLARRLRQEPQLARATLVALTGYGGTDTTRRCLEAGFDRHFTKPISEEALRGLLRAA